MRLDKWISHSTGFSRQEAQRAVRAQRVLVNGNLVKKADIHIADNDDVRLDGEPIHPPRPRYFMLHKPPGYISSTNDGAHPIVLDLLDEPNRRDLQIVGRLDIDTTGLILITDDGQWNHRISAPSHLCRKTYRVHLSEALTPEAADQLRNGVMLDGEKKPTQAAELTFAGEALDEILLIISEGKYHQVKRMIAAVGNHVVNLHRERIGAIQLDPELVPGNYRALTTAEISSF